MLWMRKKIVRLPAVVDLLDASGNVVAYRGYSSVWVDEWVRRKRHRLSPLRAITFPVYLDGMRRTTVAGFRVDFGNLITFSGALHPTIVLDHATMAQISIATTVPRPYLTT